MRGPDTGNRPRGGALVALAPPDAATTATVPGLYGDLVFHKPGSPLCAKATHARLTPSAACDARSLAVSCVIIHAHGDMTKPTGECGLFCALLFAADSVAHDGSFLELPLAEPLSLDVGQDGIIGRRVSLIRCDVPDESQAPIPGEEPVLAEGIVGINYHQPQAHSCKCA